MSFAAIAQSIHDTGFFTAIRESMLVYPIVMSLHLTCIAIFGGLILMTDLRLLGWALNSVPITAVVKQFRTLKAVGLVIMLTCGVLLAGSKATDYYDNPYFLIKISLLLLVGIHAWIFHRNVYGKTEEFDRTGVIPGKAKAAAYISLFLWLGIMSAGRWIAYFEHPDPLYDAPKSTHAKIAPKLHGQDHTRTQR